MFVRHSGNRCGHRFATVDWWLPVFVSFYDFQGSVKRITVELTGRGNNHVARPVVDEMPAYRAPVQRFVIPPRIVTRNSLVDNERARRSQVAFNHRGATDCCDTERARCRRRATQVNHEATLRICRFSKSEAG